MREYISELLSEHPVPYKELKDIAKDFNEGFIQHGAERLVELKPRIEIPEIVKRFNLSEDDAYQLIIEFESKWGARAISETIALQELYPTGD